MIRKNKNIIIILFTLLIISLILNLLLIIRKKENNRVARVIDGDSFDLADGRRIRLISLDAPERGRCMYIEAKYVLNYLIGGKRVTLSDIETDDYGRILANVFVKDSLFGKKLHVNQIMIAKGLARNEYINNSYISDINNAMSSAKSQHLGIYSPICRQTDSTTDCVIKGNIRQGVKTYHLPNCRNYDQTIIDSSYGDKWFCTESEAINEGFIKAGGCR